MDFIDRFGLSHFPPAFTARRTVIATCAIALLASGCVQQMPFPYAVRTGDTLVLAIGGVKRNADADRDLQPTDLDIVLTDSAGTSFGLEAEGVFKAYPEYGSELNAAAIVGAVPLRPFDGGWFAHVPLRWTDPGHSGGLFPLPLAVGPATLAVVSDKLTNTRASFEGDLSHIPVEILPGSADPNQNEAYAQQFIGYRSKAALKISAPVTLTDSLGSNGAIWGLQVAITYPRNVDYLDTQHPPQVVPYSHHPYIQLAQNTFANDDGTNTLLVLLTAQRGFVRPSKQTSLTPLLGELSLRLMYFTVGDVATPSAATLLDDFRIDATHSFYLNTAGVRMALQTPVLSVE